MAGMPFSASVTQLIAASTALLETVVLDVVPRHAPTERVILNALVAPDNQASNVCLTRFGLKPQGRSEGGKYILHTARIS